MKISEWEKNVIDLIIKHEITNELSFITKLLDYEIVNKNDGFKYYHIKDKEISINKYANFIQLISYLEEERLIKIIKLRLDNDTVILKLQKADNSVDSFDVLNSYREAFGNCTIVKYPSLEHFVNNDYQTEKQIESDFNAQVFKDSTERYKEEKRFRILTQVLSVIIAIVAILASAGLFTFQDNNKNATNNFFLIKSDKLNNTIKIDTIIKKLSKNISNNSDLHNNDKIIKNK